MAEKEEKLKPQPTTKKPYCFGGSNCTMKKQETINGNPGNTPYENFKEEYDEFNRSLTIGREKAVDMVDGAIGEVMEGAWGILNDAAEMWTVICDHEVKFMNAIGGFLHDSAEEVANDEGANIVVKNFY